KKIKKMGLTQSAENIISDKEIEEKTALLCLEEGISVKEILKNIPKKNITKKLLSTLVKKEPYILIEYISLIKPKDTSSSGEEVSFEEEVSSEEVYSEERLWNGEGLSSEEYIELWKECVLESITYFF